MENNIKNLSLLFPREKPNYHPTHLSFSSFLFLFVQKKPGMLQTEKETHKITPNFALKWKAVALYRNVWLDE